jgi:toxin ParE1/3/4
MPQARLSPRALRELDDIWLHIAADNPIAADAVIDAIVAKTRLIATQPMMGVARPELADDLRCVSQKHYIIFYRPLADGIEVLHVIHDARDMENAFE